MTRTLAVIRALGVPLRNLHRPVRAMLAGALGLAVTAAPSAAAAAPAEATVRAPSDGVDRVWHDYSAEGDASSLELNPAMLGDIKGLDITLLGYDATDDFTRGTGFGGFLGLGLGFGFATAFGAQVVRPGFADQTFDYAQAQNPDITKLSWGLALGDGEHGTFGIGVHGIRSGGAWLRRPDLDVGMMARIFNYASVGGAVRLGPVDLTADSLPAELSVVGEVSVRPLGTNHLELAGGATYRAMEADPGDPLSRPGLDGLLGHGRLAVRYHGVALRGEVEQVTTALLDEATLDLIRERRAIRGSVSLAAAWDFASLAAGVHTGVSEGLDGYGIKARLTSRRQGRAFWPRLVAVDRLEMAGVVDQRTLISMLQRIERAREAGDRSVLLIDARGLGVSWAGAHELRSALVRVRNAGGHVFAYVEDPSLRDYYLASAAERVFIHPAGALPIYGIASQSLYFKGALDKIGVDAEVIKVDEYKSAGERFTETGPTEPDLRQRNDLFDDIYGQVVYDIAQARGMTRAQVRALVDEAPYSPEQAVQAGLVDEVSHRDQIKTKISDAIGAEVEFRPMRRTDPEDPTWSTPPYVAVVLIEGTIIDGPSRHIPFLNISFTGSDTITETLRALRKDPMCRGIVLRVSSPGGSALASDVIWREVELTHQGYQDDPRGSPPIVVSMSDVAASGGYYVAVGTDTILADPNTVTGSIGVISIHFDVSGLLDKLGISVSTLKRGDNAAINSLYEPYTEAQREIIETTIRNTYELFTKRVANGRNMKQEKVDELGRGHVYSGQDAKALGLVDAFGGLHEAIQLVRDKAAIAGFRDLEVVVLPRKRRLLDLILDTVGDPFAGRGPLRLAAARRDAKEKAKGLRNALPLALDEALSKLPLSILYLPETKAHTLLPWTP